MNDRDLLQRYVEVGQANDEALVTLLEWAQEEIIFTFTQLAAYQELIGTLRNDLEALPVTLALARLRAYEQTVLEETALVLLAMQSRRRRLLLVAVEIAQATQERLEYERQRLQKVFGGE